MKIIGSKAVTTRLIENVAGSFIEKGEEVTIIGSYRGYKIRTDDGRTISRVNKDWIQIIGQ